MVVTWIHLVVNVFSESNRCTSIHVNANASYNVLIYMAREVSIYAFMYYYAYIKGIKNSINFQNDV